MQVRCHTPVRRDIIKVVNMNEADYQTAHAKLEKNEDPFKDKHPKNYSHGLLLETKDRTFQLFAKEYNLKELFVFVLNKSLQQKDKYKEEKERRQYNSVQRPVSQQEPIYMKTEENKHTKLTKNQSQLHLQSQNINKQLNNNNQSHLNGPDNLSISQDQRQNIHAVDNNNPNKPIKTSKKRHESVNVPTNNNKNQNLLTASANNDNTHQQQYTQDEDQKQHKIVSHQNIDDLVHKESLKPKKLHATEQQKHEQDVSLIQLNNNKNINDNNYDYQLTDNIRNNTARKRQSSQLIRRQASLNLNQLQKDIETTTNNNFNDSNDQDYYDESELIQKQQQQYQKQLQLNSQYLNQPHNNSTQPKNDIPKPRSRDNTHRSSKSAIKQRQDSNNQSLGVKQSENIDITPKNGRSVLSQIDTDNHHHNLVIDHEDQHKHDQDQTTQQYQNYTDHNSQNNQTEEVINRPRSRQKSQRPPSNHGKHASNVQQEQQQQHVQHKDDINNKQNKDLYGNLSIPSTAAKKHRKQIQERMEIALRQLNEEQLQTQQLQQIDNDSQEQVVQQTNLNLEKLQPEQLILVDNTVADPNNQLLKQKVQTPGKRKIRKRASSRLSNQSKAAAAIVADEAQLDQIDDEKQNGKLLIEQRRMSEQLNNLNTDANTSQLKIDLGQSSQQIRKSTDLSANHINKLSGKRHPHREKRQSDVIVIQPDSEHMPDVIYNRSRVTQDKAKSQKGIKERIQDVIDDRGSDLSGDDETQINNQVEDLPLSPLNNLQQPEFTKFNSYSSQMQIPTTNINQVDNASSNYFLQQRIRSTSHHEKFGGSPIRERNIHMQQSNQQFKIVSATPVKQLGKFESNYNITKQGPQMLLNSNDLQANSSVIASGFQSHTQIKQQINLEQVQSQTVELLKEGQKNNHGNEKLIEMIKSNLSQLQRFSSSPLTQLNSFTNNNANSNVHDNPYERQNSQTSSNIPNLNNQTNSDIFHGDASTRLKLLQKWENKFGKSQADDQNQNDSYEWDREEEGQDDFENSPGKALISKKQGSNTTSNLVAKSTQPRGDHQHHHKQISNEDGFEQHVKKLSQKEGLQELLQGQILNGPQFEINAHKTSTNQDVKMKLQSTQELPIHQENVGEEVSQKKKRHKKTKSQIQNHLPQNKPMMFSQTSKISQPTNNNPYNEYIGQPINIIQNFNINQLNLLNMCNTNKVGEANYCQTHQMCQQQQQPQQQQQATAQSDLSSNFTSSFQTSNQSNNQKLHQDLQHLNILERIRMAHKIRGANQTAQAKSSSSTRKLENLDEVMNRQDNNRQLANQTHLYLQSPESYERLANTQEIVQKMPKSSKGLGGGYLDTRVVKTPFSQTNTYKNNNVNILDSQQFASYGGNENPTPVLQEVGVDSISDTYSNITKNSSSKSKIILKPSQITKSSQPQLFTQTSSFKIKATTSHSNQNDMLLSPSHTQENLSLTKKSKFFNPNDINLNSYAQMTQNYSQRINKSGTPSPQKQQQQLQQQEQCSTGIAQRHHEQIIDKDLQQLLVIQQQQQNSSQNTNKQQLQTELQTNTAANKLQQQQQVQMPANNLMQLRSKFANNTQSTNNANGVNINQNKNINIDKQQQQNTLKKQTVNDTFDYNWDDETINNTVNQKNGNKASIKSKLMLNSVKNQANIVTKLQDFQDEQQLQNSSKINSVRQIIEENAQISIWD